MLLRFSLLAPLFALAVQASNVLDLDSSNFDELVGKGKPALVELYVSLEAVWVCSLSNHLEIFAALLPGGT